MILTYNNIGIIFAIEQTTAIKELFKLAYVFKEGNLQVK